MALDWEDTLASGLGFGWVSFLASASGERVVFLCLLRSLAVDPLGKKVHLENLFYKCRLGRAQLDWLHGSSWRLMGRAWDQRFRRGGFGSRPSVTGRAAERASELTCVPCHTGAKLTSSVSRSK